VKEAARINLKLRYSLLKFYYKQFVSNRGLGSIFRPLFFEFPHDYVTVNNSFVAETQFMIGKELMFAPIVDKGQILRTVYYPSEATWWDIRLGNSSLGGVYDVRQCGWSD
jgi:alpha-glucosidase (family GH31 glycosyl hydrolase)